MILVSTGYWFPNGIAVKHSADGKPELIIVAETKSKTLWGFDIAADGSLQNKRVWATVPGEKQNGQPVKNVLKHYLYRFSYLTGDHEGGPDGMDFDIDNNLLVANWGSSHIEVFAPEGGHPIERIKCPFERPSNIHFKPNSSEVFVTEHDNHAVWRFDWKRKGMPQYCEKTIGST